MKKTFLTPEINIIEIKSSRLLNGSGISGGDGVGEDINYGGVDETGTIDPASRKHNLWEEERENEEEDYS